MPTSDVVAAHDVGDSLAAINLTNELLPDSVAPHVRSLWLVRARGQASIPMR